VNNYPIGKIDFVGLAVMNKSNRTVTVGKCEIAILYGHQDPQKPWRFVFGGPFSAASFIGCYPGKTNNLIPRKKKVPGTLTHNKTVWYLTFDPDPNSNLGQLLGPDGQIDPQTQLWRNIWPRILNGALEKARELCKKKCCPTVDIEFFRNGSFLPGKPLPPLKNNLRINCKTMKASELK
jgi:hypothetical protein